LFYLISQCHAEKDMHAEEEEEDEDAQAGAVS
jgi:hypothetical protein